MTLAIFGFLFGLWVDTANLRAAETAPCRTIKQCRDLRDEATQHIRKLAPKLVRSEKTMTYSEAVLYCEKANSHLASARELATWAMGHGAYGTRETVWPGIPTSDARVIAEIQEVSQQGFHMIIPRIDMNQAEVVDFYYSDRGLSLDTIRRAGFSGFFHTASIGADGFNYIFDSGINEPHRRFKAHRSELERAFAICAEN